MNCVNVENEMTAKGREGTARYVVGGNSAAAAAARVAIA